MYEAHSFLSDLHLSHVICYSYMSRVYVTEAGLALLARSRGHQENMSPKRERSSNWCHVDGTMAGVAEIQSALTPFAPLIFEKGADLQTSKDMHQGVNQSELTALLPMIGALVRIDPRGGYLTQQEVACALEMILKDDEKLQILHAKTAKFQERGYRDQVSMNAFMIRVVMAHFRLKHDSMKEEAMPRRMGRSLRADEEGEPEQRAQGTRQASDVRPKSFPQLPHGRRRRR